MICSAISFSVMSLFVHILSTKDDIPPFEQIGFRSIAGIFLCALYIKLYFDSAGDPWTFYFGTASLRPFLAMRCIIGSVAMMCNWFIMTQLPLGDATVIVFTAPIFTIFVACVALKEEMSFAQMVCVCFSSLGVVCVARPSFLGFRDDDPDDTKGSIESDFSREVLVAIGLFGALCSACTNVLVRKLSDINGFVIVSWLLLSSLLVSAVSTFAFQGNAMWPKSHLGVWSMIVAIGFLGFLGQVFKTYGLKWENAGVGSMMRNLDLVFAFTFQVTILNEKVHTLSVAGAALTLLSSITLGLVKRWETNAANAVVKYSTVQSTETTEDDRAVEGYDEEGHKLPASIDNEKDVGIAMTLIRDPRRSV